MKRLFFLLFIIGLAVTSCAKKVEISKTDYPEFVGEWKANDGVSSYDLIIPSSGKSGWSKLSGVSSNNTSGKAKILPDKDVLQIFNKRFDIGKYPALNTDGYWTMTLDGLIYQRL